jgi:hypothetical protein
MLVIILNSKQHLFLFTINHRRKTKNKKRSNVVYIILIIIFLDVLYFIKNPRAATGKNIILILKLWSN